MALIYTSSSDLKKTLPLFSLKSIEGITYSSDQFKEKILVIMFICNHCPYVRIIEKRLLNLIQYFKNKDVKFIGICSNNSQTHPEDSIENLKKRYKEKSYDFIYLYDEDQEVAKNFEAVCTPDFFIYNKNRKQTWRGRLDNSVESEENVTKEEMKLAISNLLDNKNDLIEFPSFGCSIKWKKP